MTDNQDNENLLSSGETYYELHKEQFKDKNKEYHKHKNGIQMPQVQRANL